MEMGTEARLKRPECVELRDHLSHPSHFSGGETEIQYGERCVQCEEHPGNHSFMRQEPPDGVNLFARPGNTPFSLEICWGGGESKGTPDGAALWVSS